MSGLTVHCYLWSEGFRAYRPEHVNTLARMVRRHLPVPHRFVCVTDETEGFDAHVDLVPLPDAARPLAALRSPEGPRFPASYRRLWSFSADARALGERLLMLDVDCVITGDLTPLVERTDDFVGWRPNRAWGSDQRRIGGGTWLLRSGTKTHIWEMMTADPHGTIQRARDAGHRGSDQAILTWQLYDDLAIWPPSAGIYQSQDMLKPTRYASLPPDARIVHFNGTIKPWASTHIPWVKEHYQ